jgi:hypothetical protein
LEDTEVRFLELVLNRLEISGAYPAGVHPDWVNLNGNTTSELASLIMAIFKVSTHIHCVRDREVMDDAERQDKLRGGRRVPEHVPNVSDLAVVV